MILHGRAGVVLLFWRSNSMLTLHWRVAVEVEVLLLWCNDVVFGSLTLQWYTDVLFDVLTLITHWSCIWLVDVSITHWRCIWLVNVKVMQKLHLARWRYNDALTCWRKIDAVVPVKQKKTFILTSILAPLKKLQCLHCWIVVPPIHVCWHKYLMNSWERRKFINNTARQKQCASLIVVGPWTCCMLTLIMSTILILQYWSSIAVTNICSIDIASVI